MGAWEGSENSRHECSCHSLEEKCNGAGCASEEATDAADNGEDAEEEGADGEEETDDDEGEHKASFKEVFSTPVTTPSQFPYSFLAHTHLVWIYPKMSSVPKFLLGSKG